jgi:hypothetical protein
MSSFNNSGTGWGTEEWAREVIEVALRRTQGIFQYRVQTKQPPAGFAGAPGSATCCLCKWTNVNLLNLGEPGEPRWMCHGCCKRMLEALERILRYPVHSEPVGGAMAMQDIAHETLSPNSRVSAG